MCLPITSLAPSAAWWVASLARSVPSSGTFFTGPVLFCRRSSWSCASDLIIIRITLMTMFSSAIASRTAWDYVSAVLATFRSRNMKHIASALYTFNVPSYIHLQLKIFTNFNKEAFTRSDILLALFATRYKLWTCLTPIFVGSINKIIA